MFSWVLWICNADTKCGFYPTWPERVKVRKTATAIVTFGSDFLKKAARMFSRYQFVGSLLKVFIYSLESLQKIQSLFSESLFRLCNMNWNQTKSLFTFWLHCIFQRKLWSFAYLFHFSCDFFFIVKIGQFRVNCLAKAIRENGCQRSIHPIALNERQDFLYSFNYLK